MKKSEDIWYTQPTRQSPIAILMIIFNIVKSVVRTWWPILLILFFRSNLFGPGTAKILVAAGTILIIVLSIWRYFRFHFYLSERKLHVQSGVLTLSKLDIPFDRIQSISLEQNIVHQMFDVTRLIVDTAGSSKEEFEFAALDRKKAEALRSFILSQKSSAGDLDTDTASEASLPQAKLLLQLDTSDLLRVGVSQNHLRTTGIIVAFILGLRDRIDEALGERYVSQFDDIAQQLFENIVTYGLILFLVLLVASFFGTLVYTVFRYYDLRLWKTTDGYKLEAGLFNRMEQAALDHKIQIIRWISNPLRNIFGIVHLRLYQASSGSGSRSSSISVPGCPVENLETIKRHAFGKRYLEPEISHGVDRSMFWRRWIFIGLLPTLGMLVLAWFDSRSTWLVLGLVWLILTGFFQHYYQRKWVFYLTANECITSYGVVERVTKALSVFKVQGVQIKQTPYQRRKSLASLVMHTASGDVSIPYIPLDTALEIKNYFLYKIEIAHRRWM